MDKELLVNSRKNNEFIVNPGKHSEFKVNLRQIELIHGYFMILVSYSNKKIDN